MPGVVISGMPDQIITDIKLSNITIKLPGGGKITIDNLQDVPEKPSNYPEYDMSGELPSWGVYVRHAGNVQVTNLSLAVADADFRTAIVLDEVHNASFKNLKVRELGSRKRIYARNSSEIRLALCRL